MAVDGCFASNSEIFANQVEDNGGYLFGREFKARPKRIV
jgi:hypothetical protein